MFEKVGGTVVDGSFVAGAGVDPDADGGGVGSEHGFGGDAESGWKLGDLGGGGGEEVGGEVVLGGGSGGG